jgi:hypothetical protein
MTTNTFIVVDRVSAIREDPTYRLMQFRGATYSETALRNWAHRVFDCPVDATLPQISKRIDTGGWALLQLITPGES